MRNFLTGGLWSDSYHLSTHLRAIPEEGGVGIWEVVFQKNLLQSGDINYETWFYTTTTG